MAVLILDHHDAERELLFALEHMLSLTTEQRYRWMFDRSREAVKRMIRNGHLQSPQIIMRPAHPARRRKAKTKKSK